MLAKLAATTIDESHFDDRTHGLEDMGNQILQWKCLSGLRNQKNGHGVMAWFKPSLNKVSNRWKMAAGKALHQKEEDAAAASLGLRMVMRLHVKTQDAVEKAIKTSQINKAARDDAAEELKVVKQRRSSLGVRAKAQRQGDLDHYSANSLHKRRQLRDHPEIVRLLGVWWMGATHSFDKDDSNQLEKHEYKKFHKRLVRAFAADDDDTNDLSAEGAEKAFEEDWENDSKGRGYVNQKAFFDSVYELADTWTEGTDPEEYIDFLQAMFDLLWPQGLPVKPKPAVKLGFGGQDSRFGAAKADHRGWDDEFGHARGMAELKAVKQIGFGSAGRGHGERGPNLNGDSLEFAEIQSDFGKVKGVEKKGLGFGSSTNRPRNHHETANDNLQYATDEGGWGSTGGGNEKQAFGGTGGRFNAKTETGWDGEGLSNPGGYGVNQNKTGFGGGAERFEANDTGHQHVGGAHGDFVDNGKGLEFGELRAVDTKVSADKAMARAQRARRKAEATRLAEELAFLTGGSGGGGKKSKSTVTLSALPGHLEKRAEERRKRREDMAAFGIDAGAPPSDESTPLLDLLLDRAEDMNKLLARLDKKGTGEISLDELTKALGEMYDTGGEDSGGAEGDRDNEDRRRNDLTDDEIRIKIRADGTMEMPTSPSNLPFGPAGSPPRLRRGGPGGRDRDRLGGFLTVEGESTLMESSRSMYGGPGTGSRILRDWNNEISGGPLGYASSPVTSRVARDKKLWVTGNRHNVVSRAQANPSGGIGKLTTSSMQRAAATKGHGAWDERHEVYDAQNRNGPRWANHKYVPSPESQAQRQRQQQRQRQRRRRPEQGLDGGGSNQGKEKWLDGIQGKLLWAARKGQEGGEGKSSNHQQLPSSPMALSTPSLQMASSTYRSEKVQRMGELAVSQRHRMEEMSTYENDEQPAPSMGTSNPIMAATAVLLATGDQQGDTACTASLAANEALPTNTAEPLDPLRVHQLLSVLPEIQRTRVLELPPHERALVMAQMRRIATLADQQRMRRVMDAHTTKQRRIQAQAEVLAGVSRASAAYAKPSVIDGALDAAGSSASVASVGAGMSLAPSEGALSEASWLVKMEETWKIGFNGLTGCPYSGRPEAVPANVGVIDPASGEQVVPWASTKPTADAVTLACSPQRVRSLAAGYRQKKTVTKYFAEAGHISRQHSQPLVGTSGFQIFSQDWRNFLALQHPEATFGRVSELLTLEWRKLDDERRAEYAARALAQEQEDQDEYGVGYTKKDRQELLLERAILKAERLAESERMAADIGGTVGDRGSTADGTELDGASSLLASQTLSTAFSSTGGSTTFSHSLKAPHPRHKGMGIGTSIAAKMGRVPTAEEGGGRSTGNALRTQRPVEGGLMHAMQQSLPQGRQTSPTKKSLWEKGLGLQLEAAVDVLLANMPGRTAVAGEPKEVAAASMFSRGKTASAKAPPVDVHARTAQLLRQVGSKTPETLDTYSPSSSKELQQLSIVLKTCPVPRSLSAPSLAPALSPSNSWRKKVRSRARR
jgi:hypothetical protein